MADRNVSTPIPQRRRLRFETIEEAIREAEHLVAAEGAGRLGHCGQWTLGEALSHLAASANFAFDGYPPVFRAPWLLCVLLRPMRGWIVTRRMIPGLRIRGATPSLMGVERVDAAVGMARFRTAMARLQRPPARPHPLLGPLSHAQWIALNLRHAELHLGFQVPVPTQ